MDMIRKYLPTSDQISSSSSQVLGEVTKQSKRQLISQSINLGLIVTSALIIWKTLIVLTGSESPVVVVLSGSMEPGFYRGDILFLNQPKGPINTGDIIVFNTDGREIPIVHRVIRVHHHDRKNVNDVSILTKGDNNLGDDRSLYPPGIHWLNRTHVMGKVAGFLPYVGMMTIIMTDYPVLKYVLLIVMAFFVLTSKE